MERIGILLSRRSFIAVICLAGFFSCKKPDSQSGAALPPIELGKAAEFPEGPTNLDLFRVRVFRNGKAYRAVSIVCTHQTCLLSAREDGFDCPCHGSKFDVSGRNISGPAKLPLPWYALSVSPAGTLLLHRDQVVDSAWSLTIA